MDKYTPDLQPQETISIELITKPYVTIIDVIDSDLAEFRWYALIISNNPYASRQVSKSKYERLPVPMHRTIMERIIERPLTSKDIVDHKDCDTLNNRRSNLRLATRAESNRNRRQRSDNTSGYKGVTWSKKNKKWKAAIGFNCKYIHLGYFDNPEDAYEAYCKAAKELHGDFARLD